MHRYEEDDIDVLGQLLWVVLRVAAALSAIALMILFGWVL